MNPQSVALTIHDSQPYADSRVVAKGFDIDHDSLRRTIREHASTLADLKSVAVEAGIHAGKVSHYLLTERQVMLLSGLCRTTSETARFLALLVDAFLAMRDQLARPAVPTNLADALQLAADTERARMALAAKVEEMAPDAELGSAIRHAPDTYTASQVARLLSVPRTRLIEAYLAHKWLWRDAFGSLRAYASRIDDGHMTERASTNKDKSRAFITPRITGQGLDLTRKRLAEWGLS